MPNAIFNTPGWHSWDVPTGVKTVTVNLNGAGSAPTKGGRVTGKLAVDGNDRLWFYVGEAGTANSGSTGGAASAAGADLGGSGKGGSGSVRGGYSGAGASFVRRNSKTTGLKAVAAGAGGRSGDYAATTGNDDPVGQGGRGGTADGESGWRGSSGTLATANATGGTPIQGGNGGTSTASTSTVSLDGSGATDAALARAGAGGGAAATAKYGGGGGGGGYRSGGGGQGASADGFTPGGGGGAGSNYVGGLTGYTNERGAGASGDGSVSVEWVSPSAPNQPPNNVTDLRINGKVENSEGVATRSTGTVTITGVLDDPDGNRVQMRVDYSAHSNFAHSTTRWSDFVQAKNDNTKPKRTGKAEVVLRHLSGDTRYYIRVWAKDAQGKLSNTYNSANFWTNRAPKAPTLLLPAENTGWPVEGSITFTWNHIDSDPNDGQTGFMLQYWPADDSSDAARTTIKTDKGQAAWWLTTTESWEANPNTFKSNQFYLWRVRTRDEQGVGGAWSEPHSFFVSGATTTPVLLSPTKRQSVPTGGPFTFRWKFRDPNPGDTQSRADLRYRKRLPAGADPDTGWVVLDGDTTTPGSVTEWEVEANTFTTGVEYEWQARTYDSDSIPNISQWSASEFFIGTVTPGSAIEPPVFSNETAILGSLGCGTYRVFIYTQGGLQLVGEVDPLTSLAFDRVRDDISGCTVLVTGFGKDCGDLLSSLRSWRHEVVVYRDGHRVWEGPITRITYAVDSVGIEAKDVFAYLYRRIMKQGYNDSYRQPDNIPTLDFPSVVQRARQIALNAFAEYDPNVLPYLTTFDFSDDATEGRIVADFATTAWEEIDDLAATAGLDYTAIGRRMLFWDTHRAIGRLPEMRDGDFSDPPVVSEYGMQLCNLYAVSNNSGLYGVAAPEGQTDDMKAFFGPVEMVASAYGETDSVNDMKSQARRNVSNRWPTPLVVRVPDNSTLNPDVNITFAQLVPGVWIPLRAVNTLRTVTQWQKLDSVSVEYSGGVERVNVVMSPAPNGGNDPDADSSAEVTE